VYVWQLIYDGVAAKVVQNSVTIRIPEMNYASVPHLSFHPSSPFAARTGLFSVAAPVSHSAQTHSLSHLLTFASVTSEA
jgi:hypothetical protein